MCIRDSICNTRRILCTHRTRWAFLLDKCKHQGISRTHTKDNHTNRVSSRGVGKGRLLFIIFTLYEINLHHFFIIAKQYVYDTCLVRTFEIFRMERIPKTWTCIHSLYQLGNRLVWILPDGTCQPDRIYKIWWAIFISTVKSDTRSNHTGCFFNFYTDPFQIRNYEMESSTRIWSIGLCRVACI